MANEAVCIEPYTKIKRYTVADGVAIAKGTILRISADPNTAGASVGNGDPFAGIAIEEKVASDGITEIATAIDGVWDITTNASNGITLGFMVAISGANLIRQAVVGDFVSGAVLGKCLETASASEVVRVRLGLN